MRILAAFISALLFLLAGGGYIYFYSSSVEKESLLFFKERAKAQADNGVVLLDSLLDARLSYLAEESVRGLAEDYVNFETHKERLASDRSYRRKFDGGTFFLINGKHIPLTAPMESINPPSLGEKEIQMIRQSAMSRKGYVGTPARIADTSFYLFSIPATLPSGRNIQVYGWSSIQYSGLFSSLKNIPFNKTSYLKVFDLASERVVFSDGAVIWEEMATDPLARFAANTEPEAMPFAGGIATIHAAKSKKSDFSLLYFVDASAIGSLMRTQRQTNFYYLLGGSAFIFLLVWIFLGFPLRYLSVSASVIHKFAEEPVEIPWRIHSPGGLIEAREFFNAVNLLLRRMKEDSEIIQQRFESIEHKEFLVSEGEKEIAALRSRFESERNSLESLSKEQHEKERLLREMERNLIERENQVELLGNKYQASMRLASLSLGFLETSEHLVFIVDIDGRVVWANEKSERFGFSEGYPVPHQINNCWTLSPTFEWTWDFSSEDAHIQGDTPKIDTTLLFEFSMIKDYEGISYRIGVARDISEQKRKEVITKTAVMTDALTGMLNRAGFQDALLRFNNSSEPYSVFYIDLDKFKPVNDTYGHAAGDELLRLASLRLKICLKNDADIVARLGGDEFAILARATPEVAKELAASFVQACNMPFTLESDVVVQIGASVGVACKPLHADTPEVLLNKADEAMYAAKRGGRNNWAFPNEA